MKFNKNNKKMFSILLLSLVIIALSGCSRDSAKDIETLVNASAKTAQIQEGEYSIWYKSIPEEGTIDFMQSERRTDISLEFVRSEDDVFYEYTIQNTYEEEISENHFIKNEDGHFLLIDGEEIPVKETEGESDYVFTLLLEFLVGFTAEDVAKTTMKKDSGNKRYTVTFNESYLEQLKESGSNGLQELQRDYWIDEDGYITKATINQKELLEFDGIKDTISTDRQIEIQRNED